MATKHVIHFCDIEANWPPCGVREPDVVSEKEGVVTCKRCLNSRMMKRLAKWKNGEK